jgi:ABC-2 type transport system permease protein
MPIADQGYQHWSGELTSHAWRWLAITRRGVKSAFQMRLLLRLVLIFACIPPVVLAFCLCMWGLVERQSELVKTITPFLSSLQGQPIMAGPRDYRVEIWTLCFHFFLWWELWFAMILVLMVGPNLISQDLRYNALPLYLSRPVRRLDYFVGKLGIIVAIVGGAIIVPTCVAYVLGLLFSLDFSIVRDTYRIFLASVVYGLLIAVSAGLLMLALSSLTRNSRYVAIMWIGLWIITSSVSLVLIGIQREQLAQEGPRIRHRWANDEFVASQLEAAKRDWRPLVSYTGNLQRIEERLLGTNAAWERLSLLTPAGHRAPFMLPMLGTQFPWYWSAGVLAALALFSVAVLHFSIKSLDRLT